MRVKVTVLDVNDNAPRFESDVIRRRIYENKPIHSPVYPPIRATDADLGANAKVWLPPPPPLLCNALSLTTLLNNID